MVRTSIGAACVTVLVALAGGIATPTASHAAIYGGVFDPRTGIYGFDGSHTFSVDDACLAGTGWKAVNNDKYAFDTDTNYEKCGNASLTSLTLNVRRYASANSGDANYNEVLAAATYNLSPVELANSGILGIYVFNGELAGVDSDGFFGAFGLGNDAVGPNLVWWLKYESGFSPLGGGFIYGVDPVFLASSTCVLVGEECPARTVYPNPAIPTFERQDVPEPTTVTLVLAALGAGWLARRRKR